MENEIHLVLRSEVLDLNGPEHFVKKIQIMMERPMEKNLVRSIFLPGMRRNFSLIDLYSCHCGVRQGYIYYSRPPHSVLKIS